MCVKYHRNRYVFIKYVGESSRIFELIEQKYVESYGIIKHAHSRMKLVKVFKEDNVMVVRVDHKSANYLLAILKALMLNNIGISILGVSSTLKKGIDKYIKTELL